MGIACFGREPSVQLAAEHFARRADVLAIRLKDLRFEFEHQRRECDIARLVVTAHFQDVESASSETLREVILAGRTPVLQFSEPPEQATMERVNDFCCEFGPDLQVRFFGFAWKQFDTSIIRGLPDVVNLSVDTIRSISDFSPIAELRALSRLRFGVHEHPDGRFLQQLDLGRFTQLTLAENKRRNFDLTPLGSALSLEQLFVQGHTRGIEAICGLPSLSEVSLSDFPKRHDLAFLNDLTALRSLLLILGSRSSIAEFAHRKLQKLRIVWVRQLAELGALRRFTDLRELVIEDQLRLTGLDISGLNLRRLVVANCKNLEQIGGLERQDRLEHFSVHGTRMPNTAGTA